MLQILGPLVPVVPVLLGERTPSGEVVEALPFPLPVSGVRQLPARRPFDAIDAFQRAALGLPRGVAVDPVGLLREGLHLDARLPDAATLPNVCELGYRLDAQIQRIDEPARRGQVR